MKSYIHTPKPQIQGVEPRKRRLGIRTKPCIFGEEKNQEALICFVNVFMCKNAFGREGKCVENIQAKSRTPKSLLFFGLGVPRAFYSPNTDYKVTAIVGPPQPLKGRW